MWLVIGVAATAAVAVIVYQRLAEEQPDLVTGATKRTAQLAAVVAVLCTAVEGVAGALQLSVGRTRSNVLRTRPNGDALLVAPEHGGWSWDDE